jgi:hypothetical protein
MVDMVRLIGSISDERDNVKVPAFCSFLLFLPECPSIRDRSTGRLSPQLIHPPLMKTTESGRSAQPRCRCTKSSRSLLAGRPRTSSSASRFQATRLLTSRPATGGARAVRLLSASILSRSLIRADRGRAPLRRDRHSLNCAGRRLIPARAGSRPRGVGSRSFSRGSCADHSG